MNWIYDIPVFTTSKDYLDYNPKDHLTRYPPRPIELQLFPFARIGHIHPFNCFLPHQNQQPVLGLIHDLCTTGKIIFEPPSTYTILDIDAFKTTCTKHYIWFTNPPVLKLTSPTNNPIYYSLVSEYYNLFACAHRINQHQHKPPEQVNHADINRRYSASLVPPIAALTTAAPTENSSDSESSYSEAEPARNPTTGVILSASRLASHNVAVRQRNYKNAQRATEDPTYTYTPEEIVVKPAPRKRTRRTR
jgi:hypothetical protein